MTKEEIDGLIAELENQLKDLEAKRTGILEKLKGLKHIQNESAVSESASELKVEAGVSRAFSVGPKITLFRSLFKGREDLYARRWESIKTGKSGYQQNRSFGQNDR